MSEQGSDKYSIDSSEEVRQINISPFPIPFGLCSAEETTIQSELSACNQPIPSPSYKFMGQTYTKEENLLENGVKKVRKRSKSPKKCKTKLLNHTRKQDDKYSFISDVIVQIPLEKKLCQGNCTMIIRQHNPNEYLKIPNYDRGYTRSAHSNRDIILPQSILKSNSHDSSYVDSLKNISRVQQRSSSKKVSFEFTKEQIVSMKKINTQNPLTKQKTRYVLN